MRDITEMDAPEPEDMGTESFALFLRDQYDAYINFRVQGYSDYDAFRYAFPLHWFMSSALAPKRVAYVEANPYVSSQIREKVKNLNPKEVWNAQKSVHELLTIMRDTSVRDNVRLAAMKELNILLNITYVDENGKTRAGASLDDFYRDFEVIKDDTSEQENIDSNEVNQEKTEEISDEKHSSQDESSN